MKNANNVISTVLAAIFVFSMAACSGGGKSLNSPGALKEYLDKQPANSPDKPIKVTMSANEQMLRDIAKTIESTGKYVSLNFSGNALTTIPGNVFTFNKMLTGITIPNSVTSIGYDAFRSCTNLTSVTIGNSVTEIGFLAFSSCENLSSVTIPASLTKIEVNAFGYCYRLANIKVASGNNTYKSIDGVLFNKDGTTLIMFPYGKGDSYIIPEGVTSIGDSAFYYSVTNLTIPSSVTSIKSGALSSDYDTSSIGRGLTSVTFAAGSNITNFDRSMVHYNGSWGDDSLKKVYEAEIRPLSSTVTFVWDGIKTIKNRNNVLPDYINTWRKL